MDLTPENSETIKPHEITVIDAYILSVNKKKNQIIESLQFLPIRYINNQLSALIDGGAQINIIEEKYLQYVIHRNQQVPLKKIARISGDSIQIKKYMEL